VEVEVVVVGGLVVEVEVVVVVEVEVEVVVVVGPVVEVVVVDALAVTQATPAGGAPKLLEGPAFEST
jgi:hypothetical protein